MLLPTVLGGVRSCKRSNNAYVPEWTTSWDFLPVISVVVEGSVTCSPQAIREVFKLVSIELREFCSGEYLLVVSKRGAGNASTGPSSIKLWWGKTSRLSMEAAGYSSSKILPFAALLVAELKRAGSWDGFLTASSVDAGILTFVALLAAELNRIWSCVDSLIVSWADAGILSFVALLAAELNRIRSWDDSLTASWVDEGILTFVALVAAALNRISSSEDFSAVGWVEVGIRRLVSLMAPELIRNKSWDDFLAPGSKFDFGTASTGLISLES